MGRQRTGRRRRRVCAGLLAVLLTAAACCVSGSIKLRRVRDFMAGVLDVTIQLDASATASYDFDGDLGGFADIPAFFDAEVEAELGADGFAAGFVEADVDFDAFEEELRLLVAEGVYSGGRPLVFTSWRGESYTADKGVCYLGWCEQGEVHLAANHCGQSNGYMRCSMPEDDELLARCETCSSPGQCAECDLSKTLSKCLPEKEGGGSIDIDVDIDIDIDADIDLDLDRDADLARAPRSRR